MWLYTEVTRGCSKEFSKASGSEKNTSYLLYRFTTEEEREEDQRTARCHASKFCVVHSTHTKELVVPSPLPRQGGAAETAGCPGAAGWLAGLLALLRYAACWQTSCPHLAAVRGRSSGIPRSDRWLEGQSARMQQLANNVQAGGTAVCARNGACELS